MGTFLWSRRALGEPEGSRWWCGTLPARLQRQQGCRQFWGAQPTVCVGKGAVGVARTSGPPFALCQIACQLCMQAGAKSGPVLNAFYWQARTAVIIKLLSFNVRHRGCESAVTPGRTCVYVLAMCKCTA